MAPCGRNEFSRVKSGGRSPSVAAKGAWAVPSMTGNWFERVITTWAWASRMRLTASRRS